MPTVQEVLRESGFSDTEIGAMDQRAITAFSGVLNTAQQERQQAELVQRANSDFYDNRIVPSLVGWDEERAKIENKAAIAQAEAAFYRTQAQEAKNAGFVAQDAPTYTPTQPQQRDQTGRYVSGVPGATPGSPQFFDVNQIAQRAGDAIGILADIEWEHRRLFNQPLPVSPTELIRRADALKLDPKTYASREFNWDQKRQELQKAEQEAHDAKVRNDAVAERDKYWAEATGSNPDIRRPQASPQMTAISKAVVRNERPDPLSLNESQRRAATRSAIHAELAEAER